MKSFELEFRSDVLNLSLPDGANVLALPASPPLRDAAGAIRASLTRPIGTPPLAEVVRRKVKANPRAKAVVVVSDNTRPVPYTGEPGILAPVLKILREERVETIEVLIAAGTHRSLAPDEMKRLLPPEAFEPPVTVTNHQCTDRASLRRIGRTARGTEVWLNARYLDADIRILTGLVEPHFMAGVSGGRKSVCPGLIGEAGTYVFHGARMIDDERSDSLILDGNPCHEESVEVARMAGVDFIVNVTINSDRTLTGVYSGELEQAHRAAAAKVVETNAISIEREYDVVITHAGFVGINHYQAAKAAIEGLKAVRKGGRLIVAACHTEADPVGGANYKRILPLLAELGPDGFTRKIMDAGWTFVPEQWEVQMWGRVLRKLQAPGNLVYCSPQLTGLLFAERRLPGTDGGAGIGGLAGRPLAEAMVQRAIDGSLADDPSAAVAVIRDGPYAVPVLRR